MIKNIRRLIKRQRVWLWPIISTLHDMIELYPSSRLWAISFTMYNLYTVTCKRSVEKHARVKLHTVISTQSVVWAAFTRTCFSTDRLDITVWRLCIGMIRQFQIYWYTESSYGSASLLGCSAAIVCFCFILINYNLKQSYINIYIPDNIYFRFKVKQIMSVFLENYYFLTPQGPVFQSRLA